MELTTVTRCLPLFNRRLLLSPLLGLLSLSNSLLTLGSRVDQVTTNTFSLRFSLNIPQHSLELTLDRTTTFHNGSIHNTNTTSKKTNFKKDSRLRLAFQPVARQGDLLAHHRSVRQLPFRGRRQKHVEKRVRGEGHRDPAREREDGES